MSQENVEIVRRSIEAFNRGDAEAIAELCEDELEFVSFLTSVEGTYRSKDSGEAYFSRMRETWREWRIEDAEIFEADDEHLASIFRLVGVGKRSGARVEHPMGMTYRLRNQRIWRIRGYLDPREALKAAGLSE
jgi:ketosteroid isomerase-like protein